jgi:hypothetical protein
VVHRHNLCRQAAPNRRRTRRLAFAIACKRKPRVGGSSPSSGIGSACKPAGVAQLLAREGHAESCRVSARHLALAREQVRRALTIVSPGVSPRIGRSVHVKPRGEQRWLPRNARSWVSIARPTGSTRARFGALGNQVGCRFIVGAAKRDGSWQLVVTGRLKTRARRPASLCLSDSRDHRSAGQCPADSPPIWPARQEDLLDRVARGCQRRRDPDREPTHEPG